jgi:hypothetical protein
MTTTQNIDEMAANILAVYSLANRGQKRDGMAWYDTAHEMAVRLAKSAGHSTLQAAGIISALSPLTPWDRNQVLAELAYASNGQLSGGTFGEAIRKVRAIYDGADVLKTLNRPKTQAFATVIADPKDRQSVVIDRHAMSVALGRQVEKSEVAALNRKGMYQTYADAYRKAAAEAGITASQMQAVTWVAWRETSIRTSAAARKAARR